MQVRERRDQDAMVWICLTDWKNMVQRLKLKLINPRSA
jgi:hypothetical protein